MVLFLHLGSMMPTRHEKTRRSVIDHFRDLERQREAHLDYRRHRNHPSQTLYWCLQVHSEDAAFVMSHPLIKTLSYPATTQDGQTAPGLALKQELHCTLWYIGRKKLLPGETERDLKAALGSEVTLHLGSVLRTTSLATVEVFLPRKQPSPKVPDLNALNHQKVPLHLTLGLGFKVPPSRSGPELQAYYDGTVPNSLLVYYMNPWSQEGGTSGAAAGEPLSVRARLVCF